MMAHAYVAGCPCPACDGNDYPEDYCPCGKPGCTMKGEDFCWSCYVHEEHKGSDFRVCFECGHVWRSAEELVTAYRHGAAAAGATPWPKPYHPLMAAETIYFCPNCLHDW